MIRYLHLKQAYPFLKELHITQMIYYGLIAAGVCTAIYLTYKRLQSIGYDKKQVMRFAIICAIILIPSVYFGTRAAVMFHKPPDQWSLKLFIETLITGKGHTFHGGLIVSFITVSFAVIVSRLKYSEALDTIFLYVPVGHAIGRVACLIIGCCWGKYVRLSMFGFNLRFPNPVPLYAIGVNLAIFLFLRLLYVKIYSNPETRERLYGLILSLYLMLYSVSRIIMELFRKERKIFFKMTQAQVVMLIFLAVGLSLFIFIKYIRKSSKDGVEQSDAERDITKYLTFAGFIISYLFLLFVIYHLSKGLHIIPWPLERAKSLVDAYLRVPFYVPMLTVPVLALWWMKQTGISIREYFSWQKPEKFFYITCAFSVLYSIYLLVFRSKNLQGPAYWPPILILSLMNAVSEELVYRLSAYRLFQNFGLSKLHANLLQSLLYSLIHFLMAGAMFGILSFAYGILLAVVTDRNRSIVHPIICHFLIDIGCIGKPILRF